MKSELVIGFFFVDVAGDKVQPIPEVNYFPTAEPDNRAQTHSHQHLGVIYIDRVFQRIILTEDLDKYL